VEATPAASTVTTPATPITTTPATTTSRLGDSSSQQ
jgi:hypothetical protein